MRILLVDGDEIEFKALTAPIKEAGYELIYAKTGSEGLASITSQNPDILIIALELPDTTGFAILDRLRRAAQFDHVPVIVITTDADLSVKLKAFETGADDYLVKPFPPEELVARVKTLVRRGRALRIYHRSEAQSGQLTTTVAVHSLRGGVGCSSLAVNLAIAFFQLWNKRTLLTDGVLTAGQVAMMLAVKPAVTWGNYAGRTVQEVDDEMIAQLINQHTSGMDYVASPALPIAADSFAPDFFDTVLKRLRRSHDFMVLDLAHDFSDVTIQMLNLADWVLLVLGPEVGSLRAAASALHTYAKLGIHADKIKVILNMTTNKSGIKRAGMEKALKRQIAFVIPYEPVEVIRAINVGVPFLLKDHGLPISARLENIAYMLSTEMERNLPPPSPTAAWKRVNSRLGIGH